MVFPRPSVGLPHQYRRAVATPQRLRSARLLMGAAALLAVVLAAGCSRVVDGNPVADPFRSPASSSSSPFPPSGPLRPGDCVSVTGFTVVDCAQPHELEVYRFDPLPLEGADTYPTAATLLPRFEPRCRAELIDYLSSPDADASRLREFVYWPSRQGWDAGERWVLCAVVEIGPDDQPIRRAGGLRGVLRDGLGEFQACTTGPPSQGPLRVVRCAEPHRGEAVPGVLVLGSPTDPPVTAEQANAAAEPHCRRMVDDFLGTAARPAGTRYSWRYPLSRFWPNGYTSVVCFVETQTPVTGSLRAR